MIFLHKLLVLLVKIGPYQVFIYNPSNVGYFLIYFAYVAVFIILYKISEHFEYIGISKSAVLKKKKELTSENSSPQIKDYLFMDNPKIKIKSYRMFGFVFSRLFFYGFGLWLIYITLICSVSLFIEIKGGYTPFGKWSIYSSLITDNALYFIALGMACGGGIGVVLMIMLEPKLGKFSQNANKEIISSITESSLRKGNLTDIRELKFNQQENFDNYIYWGEAKKINSIFLGLDCEKKPIYIERNDWKMNTLQIMGNMGTGKSVQAINCLCQCLINYSDSVVVFDPKHDEYAPSVLKSHTDKFYYFDLRRGTSPQLNILKGISSHELNELISSSFGLIETNDPSDFYRDNERYAIQELIKSLNDDLTLNNIIEKINHLPKDIAKKGEGIFVRLKELFDLSCIQTNEGIDLDAVIKEGGCIYIVSSTEDPTVERLAKVIFTRINQIIKKRDRIIENKHVNIFLDEFKYMICRTSINALGTIRDKNAHIILAHQTLGDLERKTTGVDSNEVKTIVKNIPMKWIYKITDIATAEWVSSLTGQTLIETERKHALTDIGGHELLSTDKELLTGTSYLIDTNTVQSLPKFCAVLIGVGLAKLAYANPIKINKLNIQPKKVKRLNISDIDKNQPDDPLTF